MGNIVGLTTIVAVLGTLFGGGMSFLVDGGVASWVAWLYAISLGLALFGAIYFSSEREEDKWNTFFSGLFFGLLAGAGVFFISKAVVFSVFSGLANSISNVWILAIVGGIVSDIALAIVFFIIGLVLSLFGIGALATKSKW